MIKSSTLRLSVAAMALSALAGCASLGLGGPPEEQVRKRASDRIDVLMLGDFEKSFSYVAPALRDTTDWKDHAFRYAGVRNWTNATVDRVECADSRCDVTVMVSYKVARFKVSNTRPLKEVWIEVDGRWYLYYD